MRCCFPSFFNIKPNRAPQPNRPHTDKATPKKIGLKQTLATINKQENEISVAKRKQALGGIHLALSALGGGASTAVAFALAGPVAGTTSAIATATAVAKSGAGLGVASHRRCSAMNRLKALKNESQDLPDDEQQKTVQLIQCAIEQGHRCC